MFRDLGAAVIGCSLFLFVPLATLGIGLAILRRHPIRKRGLAMIAYAALIGLLFFEASSIGMALDPKARSLGVARVLLYSGLIGVATTLAVLLFSPLYSFVATAVARAFRKL